MKDTDHSRVCVAHAQCDSARVSVFLLVSLARMPKLSSIFVFFILRVLSFANVSSICEFQSRRLALCSSRDRRLSPCCEIKDLGDSGQGVICRFLGHK